MYTVEEVEALDASFNSPAEFEATANKFMTPELKAFLRDEGVMAGVAGSGTGQMYMLGVLLGLSLADRRQRTKHKVK